LFFIKRCDSLSVALFSVQDGSCIFNPTVDRRAAPWTGLLGHVHVRSAAGLLDVTTVETLRSRSEVQAARAIGGAEA